jgi:uncharacterized OB-fold protein
MKDEFPLPDTDWEPTRPFWEAAGRGEIVIPRCERCGRFNWYPRERCASCEGERMPWTRVSGRGALFSWAVVRRAWVKPFAEMAPYVTGLVSLEEDPAVRLVTLIVDCEPSELRGEMPVRAVFRPLVFPHTPREVIAPMFEPAE